MPTNVALLSPSYRHLTPLTVADASPCSTNAPATSSEGSANSSITVDNTTGRRWNPNFSPSATHGFVS
jgi:hypothetical protein